MRPEPPYDDAKNRPNRLTPRDFLTKKLKLPLMVNRKSLERSRSSYVQLLHSTYDVSDSNIH